ncbi:MAG TPA: hypothetical protein QF644_04020 [Candidatus Poseidoniaceae archaeon]|jgi:selenocysteine-specific translation elongation factor|nr:hypothetical protein [Candidatus Poseidoniaceae archaeon]
MSVLNVTFLGSEILAKEIGKTSDLRDVESYVYKETNEEGVKILSLVRPVTYPERMKPLTSALTLGDFVVLEVKSIDAKFGELLVACSCSGISDGIIIPNPDDGEWIDENQLEGLVKQAGLVHWPIKKLDALALREELLNFLSKKEKELIDRIDNPLVIAVDQFFNVKGVGLVAIGGVRSGSVNKHDGLKILPSSGTGIVRSLQVMDDDVDQAKAGDRVGIALRNADENSLTQGSLIVKEDDNDSVEVHNKTELNFISSAFARYTPTVGGILHVAIDLQFVVGRIESADGKNIVVKWESPLMVRKHGTPHLLICQLDAKPRIIGHSIDYNKLE